MKKSYIKPEVSVVKLRQQAYLLSSSPVIDEFDDNEPEGGWDFGGAE